MTAKENKITRDICKNCGHPLSEHHILNQEDVIDGEEPDVECNHKNCSCGHYEDC